MLFGPTRGARIELDALRKELKELKFQVDSEVKRQLDTVEKEVLIIKSYAKLLAAIYATLVVPIVILVVQNLLGM